nr:MAG TPA: hypothetical protein [Caudoviricetes sp.]
MEYISYSSERSCCRFCRKIRRNSKISNNPCKIFQILFGDSKLSS